MISVWDLEGDGSLILYCKKQWEDVFSSEYLDEEIADRLSSSKCLYYNMANVSNNNNLFTIIELIDVLDSHFGD